MSIIFTKVRYKNFLSTGDSYTEIALNKSPNTIIVGTNGSGKSTVADAITFVLYGKPYRKINKPQLVNSINGRDCRVEVEFTSGGADYKIIRGIKPTLFEIRKNGELIQEFAAAKDYQDYLEKNIIKMNYRSFTQIVILGSSTFVPFMQLSAAARREVIEELLDIKVFSSMNALLKDKMFDAKVSMKETTDLIEYIKSAIEMQESHIATLNKNAQEQLDENNQEIERYSELLEDEHKKIAWLNKTIAEIQKFVPIKEELEGQKLGITVELHAIKKEMKDVEKSIKFFDTQTECPSCFQEVPEEHRTKMLDSYNESSGKITENIQKLEASLSAKDEKFQLIQQSLDKCNQLQTELQVSLNNVSKYNDSIAAAQNRNASIQNQQSSIEEERIKLSKMKKKLSNKNKQYAGMVEAWDIFEVAQEILKDKGIKTLIIKQYVPIINKLVNKYLQSMNFLVNFTLDENFNEVIKSRYRDAFSYESFSEGEKSRIDLSLLLTWRAISRIKNNSTNTNLLMMDEIFDSSLDTDGGDDFMKLIYDLGADTNVFVISHNQALVDKFYSSIQFSKDKNFSRMVE